MSATLTGRMEQWFWAALPVSLTLLLAGFALIPKHMVGLSYLTLPLYMAPMFFWALLEPRRMPYWFAFTLGMVVDVVQGTPLGLSSLAYLAFLLLVDAQRKYIIKEGFVVKWGYFSLLLLGVGAGHWLALGFALSKTPPLMPAMIQLILVACLYPVLHRLCDALFERSTYRGRRIANRR